MSRPLNFITPTQFCEAWEGSNNVQEVCTKLGIPYYTAVHRATSYRAKGIELKKFKKGGHANTEEMEVLRKRYGKARVG